MTGDKQLSETASTTAAAGSHTSPVLHLDDQCSRLAFSADRLQLSLCWGFVTKGSHTAPVLHLDHQCLQPLGVLKYDGALGPAERPLATQEHNHIAMPRLQKAQRKVQKPQLKRPDTYSQRHVGRLLQQRTNNVVTQPNLHSSNSDVIAVANWLWAPHTCAGSC